VALIHVQITMDQTNSLLLLFITTLTHVNIDTTPRKFPFVPSKGEILMNERKMAILVSIGGWRPCKQKMGKLYCSHDL